MTFCPAWIMVLWCASVLLPKSLQLTDGDQIYTDQFAVHIIGGPKVARKLAEKHGFSYLGQIFNNYYHLQHHKVSKRSTTPSEPHHLALNQETQVQWFSQQKLKTRVKRAIHRRVSDMPLSDPLWAQMWYLNRGPHLDMNVKNVWKQGITGKGIVVTILDDGLEKDHPDISQNYDSLASFDVNNHDENPEPRYDSLDSNRHGTRCAGEVAAVANNSFCAVGVAFDASIGGVRMLDGDVTDAVEAKSLSLNPQHIDIYSASWGPDDDGKTVDGPGELATRAFKEGVEKGRNGLGSIFIWASGNGGREHDNCNCDGYTNSIWTLSISSATENGLVPWYSEACSSTLASTYSSGSSGEKQIVTTDLHHKCTTSHTGTSASAPLAAGICALALQANKKLTWRDMQHIVVRTARPDNLHTKDWKVNGVGRNVSHSFGYGLLDAVAMVDLARKWVSVLPQKVCEVRAERIDKLIPAKSHVELSLHVQCQNVVCLEHVQAKITLTAVRRGDIHIYLTSPSGTRSTLLALRPNDNSRAGFQNWPFMTVHSWGENPNGEWRLEVHNEVVYSGRAALKDWSLVLYGTPEDPDNRLFSKPAPLSTPSSTVPNAKATSPPRVVTVEQPSVPRFPPFPPRPQNKVTPLLNEDALSNEEPADMPSRNKFGSESRTQSSSGSSGSASSGSGSQCVMQAGNGQCLECWSPFLLLHGQCVSSCPENGFYPLSRSSSELGPGFGSRQAFCQACHYTCLQCKGPNDYDCTLCRGDAELQTGYCFPVSVMTQLRDALTRTRVLTIAVSVACPLAVCLAFYCVVSLALHVRRSFSTDTRNGDYKSVPCLDDHDDVPSTNKTFRGEPDGKNFKYDNDEGI